MEKTKLSRIRLTIISAALLLVLSIAPILSVRAEGTLLRGFDVPTTVPEHTANYWPIGVAFDGTNIYYSLAPDFTSRFTALSAGLSGLIGMGSTPLAELPMAGATSHSMPS